MNENGLCPNCNTPLLTGDGVETLPVYCDNCGEGWESPDDIVPHKTSLDRLDDVLEGLGFEWVGPWTEDRPF